MSAADGGEKRRLAAAKMLPAALLLAAGAVTLAALLRPLVAFVEPPPRQLALYRDGRIWRLEQVDALAPLAQPWQVDADGGTRIRAYRYRPIGASAAGKEVILWLTSSASSARSSRGYGGAPLTGEQQVVDTISCLPTPGDSSDIDRLSRFLPFNAELLLSRPNSEGRNSLWKQLAWLTGSHPIRQKNCYWIER